MFAVRAAGDAEQLLLRIAGLEVEGVAETDDGCLFFFAASEDADAAAAELHGTVEEIVDRNWSAEYQRTWQPMEVGRRFFLCPPWMTDPAPQGRIRLTMHPGNVFGDGDHPTTQLCLEALEEFVRPGMLLADIGAGTAILANAARALGARAVACDIDRESAVYVDMLGSVDALATARFDLVLANIHLSILRELRGELLRVAVPGGILLLSGFLQEQREEMEELFGSPVWERERGGWCAAAFSVS